MRRLLAILASVAGLFVLTWAQTFFSAAAVVAVPGCANNDAGGITPITGVEVLADTLVAGHGCGTGPDQIYKYAVVVQIPDGAGPLLKDDYIAGGVYDCFTDAVFANLCSYGTNNSTTYAVSVFAFNAQQWNGTSSPGIGASDDAGAPPDAGGAATDAGDASVDAGVASVDAGDASVDAGDASLPVVSDAGTTTVAASSIIPGVLSAQNSYCSSVNNLSPAQALADLNQYAGWKTTCTATQQQNVPVLANCLPLQPIQP